MAFFSFLSSWYLNVLHICSTVKGPLMAQLPRRCRLESTNKIAYSFPQGWWTGRLHTTAAMWCFSVQGYSEEILPSTSQHSNHRKKMAISFKFLKVPRQSAQPHIYRLLHLPSYLSQIPPQFFRKLKHIPKKNSKEYKRIQITLLRVIPSMTSIRFVTGKSSGILSDISSGILSGISSGILSGISSGILPGVSSAICSGISSGTVSGISSGIPSDILSGISSGILSGRWGPAVHTELGRSQVEVQRCALSWEGPRLRSSSARWAGKVPGWGLAVRTELGRSQVEVQQCALSSEVGEELGEELARWKWRWKLMQTWSRRNWRRRRRTTALIKSNNPHLAGGEKTKPFQTNLQKLFQTIPRHSTTF